jgi:hypothetical protein
MKQVWKTAFSVAVEAADMRVGDRISSKLPVNFDEQEIDSLRLNNVEIRVAGIGSEVGITTLESVGKADQPLAIGRDLQRDGVTP